MTVVLAVCALLTTNVFAGGKQVSDFENITFPIVTTGDTAQVSKITPTLAVMGFGYIDSMSYNADTGDHVTLTWTSPMQAMILSIGPITATPTLIDTTILLTVGCTVVFAGADELGIEYDTETGADATLATAIDSIVDIFNKATNLKDSVLAQDSGTYIKLVSKIGEGTQEGPWTMQLSTDSMDTAGCPDSVTIAMVCDSMVATINADDSASAHVTAHDSGTFYVTISDDAGLLFYHTFLNHADTHGTLAASQANVTSKSRYGDTIALDPLFLGDRNYAGVYGTFKISASASTAQGVGLSDSAYLFLAAWRTNAGSSEYFLLASDSCNALPCSLRIAHPVQAGSDTLLKRGLFFYYELSDTASDTTDAIYLPLHLDYELYEE